MKVHTLVETEESFSDPLSVDVVGSYKSLSFARSALVNRILARAQEDMKFAYAIWNDANHGEEFREYMLEKTCREDVASYFDREVEQKKFPDDVERVMYLFLLENVDGEEAYHIYVGDASEFMVHFDIVENNLEV
jgi:hypothetical protein